MVDLVCVIIFVGYDAAWHQLVRLYWDKVSLQIGNLSLGEHLLIMMIILIIVIKMGMMRTKMTGLTKMTATIFVNCNNVSPQPTGKYIGKPVEFNFASFT